MNQQTITESDIMKVQRLWADGVVAIGQAYHNNQDYRHTASTFIDQLYAYDQTAVLFKPTKPGPYPFRNTKKAALSYFIGEDDDYPDDKGFALTGFPKIDFFPNHTFIHLDVAMSMGEYHFYCQDDSHLRGQYSFGYIQTSEGALKIVLHHSSLDAHTHPHTT